MRKIVINEEGWGRYFRFVLIKVKDRDVWVYIGDIVWFVCLGMKVYG